MITKINKLFRVGLVGCAICAAAACTDTWDEHYDSMAQGAHDGTLWEAIKSNQELSNFKMVLEACSYDKQLNGSQVFTVFAPTNSQFSETEARQLIQEYNAEKGKISDEDNTVIKEFVQNHIALYNYSVSAESNDSITLMNGKYAVLQYDNIDQVKLVSKNELYTNGILNTVERPVPYLPNIFEYVRKDADLDSVRSFLYNSMFYYKEFIPEQSVAGGIENGKTVYLDSVFSQRNELFSNVGRIASEDSTYWMVVPTNEVWRQLVEEYTPYFNYANNVDERDSLVYTNTRLAILEGTTFSQTFNTYTFEKKSDEAVSVKTVTNSTQRERMWGAPFYYYQFFGVWYPKGVFSQPENQVMTCSNGLLRKATEWNIDKRETFNRYIIIEAEEPGSLKEVSKVWDSDRKDSLNTVTAITRPVESDNAYYDKVWNHSFVEFAPANTSVNHTVVFNIENVLSNLGYDIYLVTAPALANDSNATEVQRLPNKFDCVISYKDQTGKVVEENLQKGIITTPDQMEYLLMAEDFKFPVATYNLQESEPSVTLKLTTKVTSSEQRNNKYSRTLRIDCILLVPHGSLEVTDALPDYTSYPGMPGVLMYPHGQYTDKVYAFWYLLR